jgi:hypothetical protein
MHLNVTLYVHCLSCHHHHHHHHRRRHRRIERRRPHFLHSITNQNPRCFNYYKKQLQYLAEMVSIRQQLQCFLQLQLAIIVRSLWQRFCWYLNVYGRSLAGIEGSNPDGAWTSVVGVVCRHVKASAAGADPSSRGVLPTVVCHCVWSTDLKNDTALAHVGLLRQKKIISTDFGLHKLLISCADFT